MLCKICKNKDLKELKFKETYYHCQKCDLIFLDEDQILKPEEEKRRYEQHDNSHKNKGYVKMFERFIEGVIEPYTKKIETVLDFGCGPGPVLADLLKEKGFTVDIYDPYYFPERIFRGKKYDLITSTEVFEHLTEPAKEIEMLIKHIKRSGYLAIMTLFHPGPDGFKDWRYKRDPTHITFYNSNTFQEIARRYPLKIIFEDGEKYCLFKKE